MGQSAEGSWVQGGQNYFAVMNNQNEFLKGHDA